ncbi:uncharacterized protein MONOS_13192 [Monocercomonoides exilis]|uniref:uncharacterized protein n=1 Tax=Monocercomonoides exilis TaxID=2049356 RepID=UPI003559A736|nr:hypothetical protein MONOS_13192 [Monocercomonoides exilis]|eukprot:MONOS_13192.1-p1 / transcript=MONOS_13192.1 / gene=MONOS_13192 / organism=Monocercomonoides_exilis_PA203 / gene_product=unspecified product / transcript_product=unspecified product / location=Mono_scaffold00788:20265-21179(-) / protein_length=274 / sequence_SO=supercontig / SO=protein_coding / is_pseudo=false
MFLLLDVISAGLMLLFLVIASLKADAHIYRVLVSLTSLKWRTIFSLTIWSALILFARFFAMGCTGRRFNEKLNSFDEELILLGVAVFSVVVLPFLILVPLKLDGSIKLHFGFCIASLIVPFVIFELLCIPDDSKGMREELEVELWNEEIDSRYYFAIQKFEWLRMKLGLRKLLKGEAIVGFEEQYKKNAWKLVGKAVNMRKTVSQFWVDRLETEKALKIRRDYYARLKGSDPNWWESFADKTETFAVKLFKHMNTSFFKCLFVLVIVVVYLIL